MDFHLVINTPNMLYFDGNVDSLTISTNKGELTILANYQEMIANVAICKMLIRSKGNSQIFACGGGLLTCKNNEVKLLLSSIEAQDEIDYERALNDLKAAEELKVSAKNLDDIKNAEVKLKKSINRINIIDKR